MNFNNLTNKKNLISTIALSVLVLGCILPYYYMHSSWIGTQIGPPVITTAFGIVIVIGALVALYLEMTDNSIFNVVRIIVGIVSLIIPMTLSQDYKWLGVTYVGHWFVLAGAIANIILGVVSFVKKSGAYSNGTLDLNKLKDNLPKPQPKPQVDANSWICPECGTSNTGKFCSNCGAKSNFA